MPRYYPEPEFAEQELDAQILVKQQEILASGIYVAGDEESDNQGVFGYLTGSGAECEKEVMILECMHRFHKNCLTRYAEAKHGSVIR